MNPVQSYSTLHIVSKPAHNRHQQTQPLRYIEPQHGILWGMVAPIFVRNEWQLQEHTPLFIKAYHEQSRQTVIISKMNCGQVVINYHDDLFGVSHLHELEDIADVQTLPDSQTTKHPWFSELMMGLRKFIG